MAAGNQSRRLAVFVHYDLNDRIADYVVEYVRALRAETNELIFVSTAQLNQQEQTKLVEYADKIIMRENIGYDFMSWQIGLKSVENLATCTEVILANDSCYAPLFPLAEFMSRMRGTQSDFWGVTASHELGYHVQSYFMGFSQKAVTSAAFKQFWQGVSVEASKMDVVRKYEVGLSRQLLAAGFKSAVFYDLVQPAAVQRQLKRDVWLTFLRTMIREGRRDWRVFLGKALNVPHLIANRRNLLRRNPSLYGWRQGLLQRSPFIKVMLIRDRVYPGVEQQQYLAAIRQSSAYDTRLIERHLTGKP